MIQTSDLVPLAEVAWLTEQGIDLARVPIDSVLRLALSADMAQSHSGCSLLGAMVHGGRIEAGVFLLGLLKHYSEDYARLTVVAEALASYPTPSTVDALAGELRRVKGSSATRAYLRRIITTFERFPPAIVAAPIQELASDPLVGTRFRQQQPLWLP